MLLYVVCIEPAMPPPPMFSSGGMFSGAAGGPPKASNSGSELTSVLKNPSKVVLLRVSISAP